ncbi:MAG: TonB-dependent receptor [Pseudomonadota bacterium]
MLVSLVSAAAMFLPLSPATASLTAGVEITPVSARSGQSIKWIISIPAGPLNNALVAFARQTGRQITFDPRAVAGKTTVGLKGRMSASAALEKLLRGSKLHATQAGDLGIIVQQPPRAVVQDTGRANDGEIALGEITVFGERVEKSAQDTNSSVTVVTRDDLKREDVRSVYETVNRLPNVTPTSPEDLPSVRGVASSGGGGSLGGNIIFGTVPRATIVVDEVSKISVYPNNAFQQTFDLEQLELLRGPQTTLRGANAIAGAYILKTKDPTDRMEAELMSGFDWDKFSEFGYQGAAMVNLPITPGELAIRSVIQYGDGRVPVEVVATPINGLPPTTDFDRLSEFNTLSSRNKLLFTPAALPGFSTLIIGEYEKGRDIASDALISGPAVNGGSPPRTRRYGERSRIFDTEAYGVSANIAQEFDSGSILRSITSYYSSFFKDAPEANDRLQFDGLETTRFNQDLLFSFEKAGGVLDGLVGFNFRQDRSDTDIGGALPVVADGRNTDAAGFLDLTVHLSDKFRILAGGRIQRSEVIFDVSVFNGFVTQNLDIAETVFLPKIGLAVDVAEDQTVFATARRGYNPGGGGVDLSTFQPFQFESEFAWTFELGYKALLLDGKFNLAATAFFNKYKDHQFIFNPVMQPFTFIILNFDAETYGGEVEATYRPIEDVTLSAGVGLLHTKITENDPRVRGNRIGQDPEVTVGGTVVWQALPWLALDAKANYVSSYFTNFEQRVGQNSGDFAIVDLGATIEHDGWKARAFIRNLTDELGYLARGTADGSGRVTPPFTVGFNLSKKLGEYEN